MNINYPFDFDIKICEYLAAQQREQKSDFGLKIDLNDWIRLGQFLKFWLFNEWIVTFCFVYVKVNKNKNKISTLP